MIGFSIVLILFASFFFGLLLHYLAKSELKIGRKYINALRYLCLWGFLLVISVFANMKGKFYVSIGTIFLMFALSYNYRHVNKLIATVFGAGLFLATGDRLFLILSTLVLMFGLAHGTLVVEKSYNQAIKRLIFDYGFMILTYLLLWTFFSWYTF
ncbi:MAG: hypothetical protein QW331_02270 [Candidatus Woesearchaeota archaeon]